MLNELHNVRTASSIAEALKEFMESDLVKERKLEQHIAGTLMKSAAGLNERNSIFATILNVYLAENLAAHKDFDPEAPSALVEDLIADTLQAAEKQLRGVSQEPSTFNYAIDTYKEHYADRKTDGSEESDDEDAEMSPVEQLLRAIVGDDYEGCGECQGCKNRAAAKAEAAKAGTH